MELLREETLFRISAEQSISREELINFKFENSLDIIPEHWRSRKFSDFDNTGLFEIAEKLRQWDFVNPNCVSILSPQNGIGKTHLATCVLKKFIYNKVSRSLDRFLEIAGDGYYDINDWLSDKIETNSLFLSEKKLGLLIQESFKDGKSKSHLQILEYYCNLDFLVIEDLFSFSENEFERKNIFYIIDERREWRNKPTLVTSNLFFKDIAENIDTRIADRLRSPFMFQIKEPIKSFR